MLCPSCDSPTRTLETRQAEGGAALRRRRECKSCGRRFTSFERREPEPGRVVKRGGERQPFDAEKLRGGLTRAAHKRPVLPADIDALVKRIEFAVEEAGGEISSERVREMCLDGLRRLDPGAYLQFAGVELSDIEAVRAELKRLGGQPQKNPANREQTATKVRPRRRAGSGVTPKRRKRGEA